MAVHPAQIEAVMERNKRHGVQGVGYDRAGRAILADRKARRDLMKLEGFHDKHGGYADDTGAGSPLPPLPANPIADIGPEIALTPGATRPK
jgi:hypothetical protein